MSSQFAPMTSSLLVRKGDAGPSVVALPLRQAVPRAATMAAAPELATFSQRSVPGRAGAESGEKLHHIRVAVTSADLQKIGIAAAKTGGSRQTIVHAALRNYFAQLAEDLDRTCSCMADEACPCAAMDPHPTVRSVAPTEAPLDRSAGRSAFD